MAKASGGLWLYWCDVCYGWGLSFWWVILEERGNVPLCLILNLQRFYDEWSVLCTIFKYLKSSILVVLFLIPLSYEYFRSESLLLSLLVFHAETAGRRRMKFGIDIIYTLIYHIGYFHHHHCFSSRCEWNCWRTSIRHKAYKNYSAWKKNLNWKNCKGCLVLPCTRCSAKYSQTHKQGTQW